MNKLEIAEWFKGLQERICSALEQADGKAKFQEDIWEHKVSPDVASAKSGGGGRTRVIMDGNVFEKGGVNFSAVDGELPDMLKKELGVGVGKFFATGVSIVIHPSSPLVPIIHMNVRYFETTTGSKWFGGGIDLTPIYVDKADAAFFHQSLKAVCDKHHATYYPEFKNFIALKGFLYIFKYGI